MLVIDVHTQKKRNKRKNSLPVWCVHLCKCSLFSSNNNPKLLKPKTEHSKKQLAKWLAKFVPRMSLVCWLDLAYLVIPKKKNNNNNNKLKNGRIFKKVTGVFLVISMLISKRILGGT